MRRQLVAFALATVAVLAGSLRAEPAVGEPGASETAGPTVAVQRVAVSVPPLRDEALMVLVGAGLIGLAAAVRRAA